MDLAIVGMGLITTGSLVASVCATVMWLDARDELRIALRELKILRTPIQLTDADIIRPHVMCGACGLSVPLEVDGFTIAEHNCDTRDLFSDYDLQAR